ncbi:acetolactate synthase small subunit [Rubrivirga sp. IMCC43871]|uniref:acetolactate synthase small subunit n=1 Tax=Rubrivirga sp. IMCC43871 TaxID=3391575 RepID=UPI003990008C
MTHPGSRALTPQQLLRKRADGETVLADAPESPQAHVLSVLIENHAGALNRVVNLFSARNLNLDSVSVGPTDDPTVSRLTVVTTGSRRQIRQAVRLVRQLLDVLALDEFAPGDPVVERELCLVKLAATAADRSGVLELARGLGGTVVHADREAVTVQLTGLSAEVDAFIEVVSEHGLLEVARSGRLTLHRQRHLSL